MSPGRAGVLWGPGRAMADGEYYVIDLAVDDFSRAYLQTTFKSKAEALAWIEDNQQEGQDLDWGTNGTGEIPVEPG